MRKDIYKKGNYRKENNARKEKFKRKENSVKGRLESQTT